MRIGRRELLLRAAGVLTQVILPAAAQSEATMEATQRRAALVPRPVRKTRIFHSGEGFGPVINLGGLTDSTLVKRGNRWWLYLAGFDRRRGMLNLWSASLPAGKPLAGEGWSITTIPGDPHTAMELAPPSEPGSWDGSGGRHCPSYVRGWDPQLHSGAGGWQERIYYAGSAGGFGGPYSIGFLAWEGDRWARHDDGPVFAATEQWEANSVFEPNLVYHDGRWRMWYAAGPDASGNVAQGYAESRDGRTNWQRRVFWPAKDNVFDQSVLAANGRFEAVLAIHTLGKPASRAGLWWMRAHGPVANDAGWSEPVLLLNPFDGTPWHDMGVWKPSIQYSDTDPKRLFIFFDGASRISAEVAAARRGMPFDLTLGCLECELSLRS